MSIYWLKNFLQSGVRMKNQIHCCTPADTLRIVKILYCMNICMSLKLFVLLKKLSFIEIFAVENCLNF